MSKVGAVKRNLMEFSNSLNVGTCGPGMALTKYAQPTPENQENLRRFFELTERPSNIDYFFEPRGDWAPELVKALCVDLHLYHANDPLETATITPQKIYFRLHGVSGYRYDYDEFDLQNIFKLASKTSGGFVFFNNTRMTTNAQSFLKIVESSKKSPGTR